MHDLGHKIKVDASIPLKLREIIYKNEILHPNSIDASENIN